MITDIVWMDDSKLLQESNLTAGHHIALLHFNDEQL